MNIFHEGEHRFLWKSFLQEHRDETEVSLGLDLPGSGTKKPMTTHDHQNAVHIIPTARAFSY